MSEGKQGSGRSQRYCTSCGSQNRPEDAFCVSCGQPLAQNATSTQQRPAQSNVAQGSSRGRNRTLMWSVAAGAMVVLIAVGVVGALAFGDRLGFQQASSGDNSSGQGAPVGETNESIEETPLTLQHTSWIGLKEGTYTLLRYEKTGEDTVKGKIIKVAPNEFGSGPSVHEETYPFTGDIVRDQMFIAPSSDNLVENKVEFIATFNEGGELVVPIMQIERTPSYTSNFPLVNDEFKPGTKQDLRQRVE